MMKKQSDIVKLTKSKLDFSAGCLVMGILNVTPDSFSDGGEFFDTEKAIHRGQQIKNQGASIIDIGGESTRPGAEPITAEQQIKRIIPVIEGLVKKVTIPISIDTYNYKVAVAALDAGAQIINDITGLADERIGRLAAEKKAGLILMHMKGDPQTMQIEPKYDDVVSEIRQFLIERAQLAQSLGVDKDRIFIDPGIGFGKTVEHNLLLLQNIDKFISTGYRVLVGTSRKGFIGRITGKKEPAQRLFGTAATVALCAEAKVSIVRVHDVEPMVDVIKMVNEINQPKLF
jgi:dihydropteroate synthase